MDQVDEAAGDRFRKRVSESGLLLASMREEARDRLYKEAVMSGQWQPPPKTRVPPPARVPPRRSESSSAGSGAPYPTSSGS